jgi:hypothetical protein
VRGWKVLKNAPLYVLITPLRDVVFHCRYILKTNQNGSVLMEIRHIIAPMGQGSPKFCVYNKTHYGRWVKSLVRIHSISASHKSNGWGRMKLIIVNEAFTCRAFTWATECIERVL